MNNLIIAGLYFSISILIGTIVVMIFAKGYLPKNILDVDFDEDVAAILFMITCALWPLILVATPFVLVMNFILEKAVKINREGLDK